MSSKISRTKIARYTVDQLLAGSTSVLREVAAFLVDGGRVRETDLVLRSLYDELESRGVVLADVTTATDIEADIEAAIADLTNASQLTVRQQVNPSVIGGIRIQTPSKILDATVARRIAKLRERKI